MVREAGGSGGARALTRSVLILGADGFIGRHIAFHLRDLGWDVTASARRVTRLARMGFATLRADSQTRHPPARVLGAAPRGRARGGESPRVC